MKRSKVVMAVLMTLLLAGASAAQDSDTTPPSLTSFTFAPLAIDVTATSQDITITLGMTDDLAGAWGAFVRFTSPSGVQDHEVAVFSRIAGDGLDGTYEAVATFDPFIEAGTWTVDNVHMVDRVDNRATLYTADLAAAGFPTELEVTSVSDTEGPTLTDVVLAPAVIDVSAGPQQVSVDLQVADSVSGVLFGNSAYVLKLRSPSGNQLRFKSDWEDEVTPTFLLTSGDASNGTWSATVTFPQFTEPGTWEIVQIVVGDAAGNFTDLSNVELAALGLARTVDVISAPSDTTPPVLVDFDLSPSVIDTASSPQSVVVTLSITDDLAGVDFSSDTPYFSYLFGAVFKSPSGAQEQSISNFGPVPELVAGTVLDGVWQATLVVPQFSEAGTWRATRIRLKDVPRSLTDLSAADLESMGLQRDLIVIRPSLVVDGVIADPAAGGTVEDETFGDRAQVVVPPSVLNQPTEVAIDVLEESFSIPSPQGFTADGTRFVNIDLEPEPAYPLPAPGLTVVLPVENPLPAGVGLSLFRIDPATGDLVPALDVSGEPVVGTVDAGGLSATFAGIARLSTVVGLLPVGGTVLEVSIDVRPCSALNPINLRSKGVIPVAILTTVEFDAVTVEPLSVGFGPGEAAEVHGRGHLEDVDYDGDLDLVLHFRTQEAGIVCGDATVGLTGATADGMAIEGTDSITTVRCN